MSAPAGFFKPVTKRERAGLMRALGLLRDRIVRQKAKPNPALAKAPALRVETRYYTKADLMRRWLKRGQRRPLEGEAARLILDMPTPVGRVLETVRSEAIATSARLDALEARQRAVLADLDFSDVEPEVLA